jgi:hypothetical protein
MKTYIVKKRITDKYATRTLVVEEWVEDNQRYQRVELLGKGQRSGSGKNIVYGISPVDEKCYNLESIIDAHQHLIFS